MKKLLSFAALFILLLSVILVAGADAPVDATLVDETLQPGAWAPNATVPASGLEYTILDDFNRADGPIGDDWTIRNGGFNVVNNAVQGGYLARATYDDYAGDGMAAEADIANNGTSLQFTGILLNYGAGVSNLFIKMQNQSGGNQFGNGGCYIGNNQNGFGLGFFTLDSPFSTAHMAVTRVGDTVTIELTNVDGGAQPDQTYICDGAPAAEGTGIGILGYNSIARLDNFGIPGEPGGTIHVDYVEGFMSHDYLGRPILRAHVWVADDGGTMMSDVLVDASIWVPDGGPYYRSRYTKPSGAARFHYGSVDYGIWTLCIDDLTLEGYTYNPDDNYVTCMVWYY